MQPFDTSKLAHAYEWQQTYLDAMVAPEEKFAAAIELAIETIAEREKILFSSSAIESEELNAIADALANLRSLKKAR